jgi:hypothetical protein
MVPWQMCKYESVTFHVWQLPQLRESPGRAERCAPHIQQRMACLRFGLVSQTHTNCSVFGVKKKPQKRRLPAAEFIAVETEMSSGCCAAHRSS